MPPSAIHGLSRGAQQSPIGRLLAARRDVTGEYLTGAAGQLPAAGLVTVMVDDDDFAAAEGVVADIAANRLDPDELDDAEFAPGLA